MSTRRTFSLEATPAAWLASRPVAGKLIATSNCSQAARCSRKLSLEKARPERVRQVRVKPALQLLHLLKLEPLGSKKDRDQGTSWARANACSAWNGRLRT